MQAILEMSPALHQELWSHLLPDNAIAEQAAFVLCDLIQSPNAALVLHAIERFPMSGQDICCSQSDYLELSDDCRGRLIKRAHDTGRCLVEFHSHLGVQAPAFSLADKLGLEDFVPHVRWRLKQRPYAAIVVSRGGFDGLVWATKSHAPQPLTGLSVGDRLLSPSHRTLPYWRSCHVRHSIRSK